ncbi:hypothetical protein ACO03_11115 [Pantoea ananatis]|nr:hypothetical protein ACO03_11115 [Pantoea ananatis]
MWSVLPALSFTRMFDGVVHRLVWILAKFQFIFCVVRVLNIFLRRGHVNLAQDRTSPKIDAIYGSRVPNPSHIEKLA